MLDESYRNLCIFHTLDGLRDGLSHYSHPSRAALIYAIEAQDPIRVYDPQNLLHGHEPILKELYLDSDDWSQNAPDFDKMRRFGQIQVEENLQLAGLISCGGRSHSVFYQMWFTEHHPDMCSTGPTLSHDLASDNTFCTGTSGYVLREYATHAVRDYIVDEMNRMLGPDSQIRVYPILDAVLGISRTREEGAWPYGELLFIEPQMISQVDFIAKFPPMEQPALENFKHTRKLLQSVEDSRCKLISDGQHIVGIAHGEMPKSRITADFRGRHGFLSLNGDVVCSFSDGSFHSTTHRAKMVQLEETLLESRLEPSAVHEMFKIVSRIVHTAEDKKYGCTLVIDLNGPPVEIAGQTLEKPLALDQEQYVALAEDLAKVDGALHLGADRRLHGFACLLDGRSVASEDRSRGARFNSALRFTAENPNLIVVVVSGDRPVSVIQEGVELSAQCALKPFSGMTFPPTLQHWISESGV
jgi:hypothetical protein